MLKKHILRHYMLLIPMRTEKEAFHLQNSLHTFPTD